MTDETKLLVDCCGRCHFFKAIGDGFRGPGRCRRYPPQVFVRTGWNDADSEQPRVNWVGWCGEFRKGVES